MKVINYKETSLCLIYLSSVDLWRFYLSRQKRSKLGSFNEHDFTVKIIELSQHESCVKYIKSQSYISDFSHVFLFCYFSF